MKRFYASCAIAVAVLGAGALTAPARAAPPTVTPSPGYDARLQEQRAASATYQPALPLPQPIVRRHMRRHHQARGLN